MNKESDWIPCFTPDRWLIWVENTQVVWDVKNTVNSVLTQKPYKSTLHKNNWIYHIVITKEIADNGNMILLLSLKFTKEGGKAQSYKFKIWLNPWWKIWEAHYDHENDTSTKYVQWATIRYIQKIDKNHWWARFASHGEPITWFWYFNKYHSLDISHDELMFEIKQALIQLGT